MIKEIKRAFDQAKTSNDKEGIFAYKQVFDEGSEEWGENIWSKRLGAGIEKFVVNNPYKIRYTADQGNRMYNERLYHHRFHGAPDLTIFRSGDKRGVAIAMTGEASGEGRYKDPRLQMTILKKSGELANMHVTLVHKMLKAKQLGDSELQSLEVDGILISRPSGIVTCKYVMPVVWFGGVQLQGMLS